MSYDISYSNVPGTTDIKISITTDLPFSEKENSKTTFYTLFTQCNDPQYAKLLTDYLNDKQRHYWMDGYKSGLVQGRSNERRETRKKIKAKEKANNDRTK